MTLRRLRCALALLAALAMMPALPAAAAARPAEHPQYGPASTGGPLTTDDMPAANRTSPPRTSAAPRATAVTPFLTRPYWHSHVVTSIFDHCNPDYTSDGRVCEFDGTVALKTSGVDPTFNRGYAITPKGADYLYYDGHNGWDYALSYEPVVAAAGGTVQSAQSDGGFGLSVTIDHGNGYGTRYAHLSEVAVAAGDVVGRGQQIGTSGNTGNSTGPHLHFGVYLEPSWTAIDPWGWTGPGADPWPSDTGNLWIGGTPRDAGADAPAAVTATVSGNSVTVAWKPGASDGGSAITGYRINSTPAAESLAVGGASRSATLSCLPAKTAFTFTVSAVNGGGPGAPSAPSNKVTTATAPTSATAGTTGGYNLLTTVGGIFSFCGAGYFGNLLDHGYPGPAVGLGETPSGRGYNILTSSGALYSFGDAGYLGNLLDGGRPGQTGHSYPGPATALAYAPSGRGYAILTSFGGIYNFGESSYYGNLIDHHYPGTAVGLAYTGSGRGYWILTAEGGLYSFGDAAYYGNLIDHSFPGLAKSISTARDGAGYAIMTSSGEVYPFGSQPYFGSIVDHGYPGPAEAISNTP